MVLHAIPIRLRLRLRTLLLLMTLVAGMFGCVAVRIAMWQDYSDLGRIALIRLDHEGFTSLDSAAYRGIKKSKQRSFRERIAAPIHSLGHWFFAQVEYVHVYPGRYIPTATGEQLSQIDWSKFPYLRGVSLANTEVTDGNLQSLAGAKRLEELSLENTAVSDAGLQHLSNIKSLRTLNLTNTAATVQGIQQLRKALPRCDVIY